MAAEGNTDAIEMKVTDVRLRPADGEKPGGYVIVLDEVGGARRLPIWVGRFEGESLALQLEKGQTLRPLTYAFVANLLQASGARLREVHINRLSNDTYYAAVVIEGSRGDESVDARPSDAINLALVVGAPIRVELGLLNVLLAHPAYQQSVERLWGERTQGAAEIVAEMGSVPGSGIPPTQPTEYLPGAP